MRSGHSSSWSSGTTRSCAASHHPPPGPPARTPERRPNGEDTVTALEALRPKPEPTPPPRSLLRPECLPETRGRWWQIAVALGGFLVLLPASCLIAIAIKL